MQSKTKVPYPAVLCALILPLCALAVWPVTATGMNDDWSYLKTVQVLAQTGHIAYNGWATAMLGWQLYFGALLAKLFGFSLTTVRMGTLAVAAATGYLLQRTFVRAGVREWNAALGTLTLLLCPVFLETTFSFMSDVYGIFTLVVCLYACLRALQSGREGAMIAWLCFAAVSNAVGGTARQIAWVGVLVMVPSTMWLLRRHRKVVIAVAACYVLCVAGIFASMHWFAQQPYSITESIVPKSINREGLTYVLTLVGARGILQVFLFMVPVSLLFVPLLRRGRRALLMAAGLTLVFLIFAVAAHHRPYPVPGARAVLP